jgi:hypothetical protein
VFCFSIIKILWRFNSRYKSPIKESSLNLILSYLCSFHLMLIICLHLICFLQIYKFFTIYKIFLYTRRDSNSHTLRQRLLRPQCLPFHHSCILLRSRLDLNQRKRFCRPPPNHSDTGPLTAVVICRSCCNLIVRFNICFVT